MSLFKKKEEVTESSHSSTGDEGPLAGVKVVNGHYEFEGGANDNEETGISGETRDRVQASIMRLYTDERFHSNVVGLLSWVGKKKGLSSLQVDPDDEGFRDACDVVYRRLMDGPLGPVLDRIGDAALEDIIICMAGFSPVAFGVASELRQRKKMAANENRESDNE